jgi:tRNA threonylcarbamoyl adenosine modification protein (Sua5/YciO/YrdC/YwlC family)
MSQYLAVHPTHPQPRLIAQAAAIIRLGGVIAYPTDSCYAIGCHIGDKEAMRRLRTIRNFDDKRHLTLMCRDLSEIATYAQVDNVQYRLLKKITPGSYTFILQASRGVPRRLLHPRRKTIGMRVPEHAVAHALLAELGEPLLSATLILPGDALPLNDGQEIYARLEHALDLVLDGGSCGIDPTTIVDLTGAVPQLVRQGKGSVEPFGFEALNVNRPSPRV